MLVLKTLGVHKHLLRSVHTFMNVVHFFYDFSFFLAQRAKQCNFIIFMADMRIMSSFSTFRNVFDFKYSYQQKLMKL